MVLAGLGGKPMRAVASVDWRAACEACGLPGDAVRAVEAAADRLRREPAHRHLLRRCHEVVFARPFREDRFELLGRWTEGLGDFRPLFHVLVLLENFPELTSLHRSRGVPDEITAATLSDLRDRMVKHHGATGCWGLPEINWLSFIFSGRIFRVGRFQFVAKPLRAAVCGFRHRIADWPLLLAREGLAFRPDGQRDGTNSATDRGAWRSVLRESADGVEGNPVHPDGRVLRQTVFLPAVEWRREIGESDNILDTHIPEGGGLGTTDWRSSFADALFFFDRCFPEVRPLGFDCQTWMLDNQLPSLLPAGSGIRRFQEEFYLYPVLSDDRQTMERVFGGEADGGELPMVTSLQKKLAAFIGAGGSPRQGGGLILRDDVGAEDGFYRRVGTRLSALPGAAPGVNHAG